MARLIEIKANIGSNAEVSLLSLLGSISNFREEHNWAILELEAIGDLGNDKSIIDLENDIKNSPTGMCFSWHELCKLASKFHQIIWIDLVAFSDANNVARYKTDEELFMNYPIVINMIDGWLWRIYSSDEQLIDALMKKFIGVNYLEY